MTGYKKPFKKDKALTIKVRPDELEFIRTVALKHGLTMSDYVRCLIFGTPEYFKDEQGRSYIVGSPTWNKLAGASRDNSE